MAKGDEEVLEQLTAAINIKNTLIDVENVESSDREATREFSAFYKIVKEGETDERLDTAANLLKELIGATNKGFSTLNNTMISGFNKLALGQDRMLEKQDTSINILEKVHGDTSEIKSTLSRIEVDVKDTRYSLSSNIEEKHQKLENEIAEIKATLVKI